MAVSTQYISIEDVSNNNDNVFPIRTPPTGQLGPEQIAIVSSYKLKTLTVPSTCTPYTGLGWHSSMALRSRLNRRAWATMGMISCWQNDEL